MASTDFAARLARFWVFQDFAPEDLAKLSSFVEEKTFATGRIVFQQDDLPDCFYLLEQGQVLERGRDAKGSPVLRRQAQPGDCLAHRALAEDLPHQATATVTRNASMLAIRADRFRTVLAMFPGLRERLLRTKVVSRLMAIPLFGVFSIGQLSHIADLVREVQYPAGETIFREGEPADALYVIDVGQVVEKAAGIVPGTQTWPKYLTAGSFFGRYGLLHGTTRRATAMAATEVHLFRIDPDAFDWLRQLEPRFDGALKRPDVLHHLRQCGIFSRLDEGELKQLAGYVGVVHCRPGELLYRQGETDPTLYILYEGEAIVRGRDEQGRERPRGYLRAGMAVGESSLFLRESRDVTVESTTETNWFYLTQEDLQRFLAQQPQARDKLTLQGKVTGRQKLKRFPWMDEDEQFVLRARRHWFSLVNRLVLPALVMISALVALLIVPAVGAILLVPAGLWIVWRVIDWFNDYYLVTTKRVAHREKVLLVSERRDETPLDKVTNVNIDRGFLGNLFGFGTLFIDTAATTGVTRVSFTYLSDPEGVQRLVFEQMSRLRAGERLETHRAIRDKLDARVGPSLHPTVAKPAVPSPADPASLPAGPDVTGKGGSRAARGVRGFLRQLGFWIEDRSDEQVTWRKHWIRLLTRIWMPVLVLVAVLFVLVFSVAVAGGLVFLVSGLLALVALAALGWLWWGWTDWGNDQYIVTKDKVIDVEKKPLGFRSKRVETTFDKVQNVSFDIPDPIATILNYGTVMIHTAGAEGRLDFLYVRDPKRVQAEVFQRLTAYQAAQRRQLRDEQLAELPEWFAAYEERSRRRP